MQRSRSHGCRDLLAALVLLCLPLGSASAAVVEVVDGVPHVRNGAEPAQGGQDLHLKELWRVGGTNEDVLLGAVGHALIDETGNVYLLDSQLCQALVISPEGKLVRTLGGQGDGPGETRGMATGFFMPNGDLAMVQTFPGKVVTVKRDGTPVGTLQFLPKGAEMASMGVLVAGDARQGALALTGMTMSFENTILRQTFYLSFCDLQGVEQQRCFSKESVLDYANLVGDELALDFAWSRWALGPDGHLFAAPERTGYRIQELDPTGKLVRVIERAYEPYKRSASDKALAHRYVEAVYRNYQPPPTTFQVEDLEADLTALFVSAKGELWTLPSRGTRDLPEGVAIVYDVFDREGQFVRQAAVHGDFDPDRDLVRILRDDRLLVVVGAGEGYLSSMGVGSDQGSEGGTSGESAEAPLIEAVLFAIQ